MVTGTPDQNRQLQSTEVSVLGWQRQGLVVELVSNKVNRVVSGGVLFWSTRVM